MVFESRTCLYVSSIHKPHILEKKFLNFSKLRIFSYSLLFSCKTVFLQLSADFVTGFKNIFFIAQVIPQIYAKNTSFKNSWMCFFVTHCIVDQAQYGYKSHYKNMTLKVQIIFCKKWKIADSIAKILLPIVMQQRTISMPIHIFRLHSFNKSNFTVFQALWPMLEDFWDCFLELVYYHYLIFCTKSFLRKSRIHIKNMKQ